MNHDFTYLHDCVSCPREDVDALIECIDNAIDITRRTFLRHVSKDRLDDHADSMGYETHPSRGLTMAADWHITYHRSRFKGKLCYFFKWSGIEHLYIRRRP